jgi:hypothetical protein
LEPVVGGVFVGLVVAENVVAVYGPAASNPLVELLVDNAFLGQLMVKLLLGGNLELGVELLGSIVVVFVVVLVMAVTVAASASHGGVSQLL